MDYRDKDRRTSESASDITPEHYDEAFLEPPKDESLHRALKARQISMIAVRLTPS